MIKWLFLALAGLVGLVACGEDSATRPNDFAELMAINVTATPTTLAAGTSVQLAAEGVFDGFSRPITDECTWTSSAPEIATVDTSGRVRGVAPGQATITASRNSDVTGTIEITVSGATISSVAVAPATASIPVLGTQQFTATGTFSDTTTQDITLDVTWASSDPAIATVSAAGVATGVKEGTAEIRGTFGAQSAAATLTVAAPVLQSITVSPDPATLIRGATQTFTVTGRFNNGTTAPVTTGVTWSSSNTSVATIDAGTGIATGGSTMGTTTITATITGSNPAISDTAQLTVASPTAIEVKAPSTPIQVGGAAVPLTATATFNGTGGNRTLDVTRFATWDSANENIATVSNEPAATKGEVTGQGVGSVEIRANVNGVIGRLTVTVTNGGGAL